MRYCLVLPAALLAVFLSRPAYSQLTMSVNKLQLVGGGSSVTVEPPASGGAFVFQVPEAPSNSSFVLTESNSGQTITDGLEITDYLNLPTGTELRVNGATGTANQLLGLDGTGALAWVTQSAGTVTHNATLSGNGTSGSPLAINLGNANTWTSNQTFAGTFLITSNARIAMTNSDNNARDLRFQEPSGTGTMYIGLRAPSVSTNGNYRLPASVPPVGGLMTVNYSNYGGLGDSAYMNWAIPNSTLTSDGSALGINLGNSNTWTAQQNFNSNIKVGSTGTAITTILAGSATADMADCPDNSTSFIDIIVAGAIPGNPVMLGLPDGIQGDGRHFVAWVQANDNVRVSFVNESGASVDLGSATYSVVVFKF